MAKKNEIGVDHVHKGHHCENCGEPFGFQELTSFFVRLRGNTFVCFRCTEPNYLAPHDNMMVTVGAAIFSVLVGLIIFGAINIFVPAIDRAPGYTTYWLAPLVVGAFLGTAIGRFIYKAIQWKVGRFTTDRSYKSYSDVGYD
ncbi:hypothetical protein N9W89_07875 [Hellea sp.]|nr:hypothetical protein [Hellea sp.]